jgi:hypothetical protein
VAEEIAVCPGLQEILIAFPCAFSQREGNGTVRVLLSDLRYHITEKSVGIFRIFSTLQHKCAIAKGIALFTASEDLFLGQTISLDFWVVLADSTVEAVVPAEIAELNQATEVYFFPIVLLSHLVCCLKQSVIQFIGGQNLLKPGIRGSMEFFLKRNRIHVQSFLWGIGEKIEKINKIGLLFSE